MADRKKNNEVIENTSTSFTKWCTLLLNDDIMYHYKHSIFHDTTYGKSNIPNIYKTFSNNIHIISLGQDVGGIRTKRN